MDEKLTFNAPWILRRADPYVLRHGGWYYFTASVPLYDRIVLRRSATLAGLVAAEEKILWTKHPAGIMSEHIWAPEIHYLFGKWVIYFAGGDKDDVWEIRPYVLVCTGDDPYEDLWEEAGPMQCADDDDFSFRAFSLDATTFTDHGTPYFIWAEKTGVGKKISNLYIAKMESEVKLATVQVQLTTPDYDWERVGFWVNEGPAILRRNDEIYLTFSASETGIYYCMGMLTAKSGTDLLDPLNWKKQRYPVLKTDENRGIFGPGHNSFTTDETGRDVMIYHARTEAEITGNPLYNPNRHAFIMPVKWTLEGPVFSFDNE